MRYICLNKPYSYNRFIQDATLLSIAYPDFLKVKVVGCTVSNRSILMIRAGQGKRGILLSAGVHGRESINTIVLTAMLEEYAYAMYHKGEREMFQQKYGIDIWEFFHEFTLYVIPLLNPDGYMIALNGYGAIHKETWQKNAMKTGIPYTEWKYNQCGVDINRNFPSKAWRAKFVGDKAGTELETQALMNVMVEIETEAYIDYHSRGNEIYYYRNQMPEAYNIHQLKIARKLSQVTGYTLVKPEREIDAGDTGGNTVHFYSEQTGYPAITIETLPEEVSFPLPVRYQRAVYRQLLCTPFVVV